MWDKLLQTRQNTSTDKFEMSVEDILSMTQDNSQDSQERIEEYFVKSQVELQKSRIHINEISTIGGLILSGLIAILIFFSLFFNVTAENKESRFHLTYSLLVLIVPSGVAIRYNPEKQGRTYTEEEYLKIVRLVRANALSNQMLGKKTEALIKQIESVKQKNKTKEGVDSNG